MLNYLRPEAWKNFPAWSQSFALHSYNRGSLDEHFISKKILINNHFRTFDRQIRNELVIGRPPGFSVGEMEDRFGPVTLVSSYNITLDHLGWLNLPLDRK